MKLSATSLAATCVTLAVLTLLLGVPQPSTAQPSVAQAGRSPVSGVTLLLPDESEPSVLRADGRFSALTGAPLSLYAEAYPVRPGAPESMAREYLRDHASRLRLRRTDLSDLEVRAVREADSGTVVRLRQLVDGVPVYGAEIAVTLDARSRVTFVSNSYRPVLQLASTRPSRTAGQALEAARARVGITGDLAFERLRLVVYAGNGQGAARLAWEVRMVAQDGPVGDWEVLMDAHSGEIFKVADRALYAPVDGTATVFDPDPLSAARATYGDPGFTDGSDADTVELNAQRVVLPLRDIDLTAGVHSLVGPFAAIGDFENPRKGTFSQASPDFVFTRTQDGFEAVLTYYHIDNIMRWINVTLGCNIVPFQYSGGVQFDPHGLNGSDNSHYVGSTGQLAFGEGGVDDAEDADVVIHELGHGVHDWVTGGSLSQVDGLSEGFGDYLAASYSRSLAQWTPADPQFHWVFNWDGHNPFWAGRITNYSAIYPGGLVGQIHTDGQIWSTCNMKIWDQIGRQKTDKAIFEGLGMTNSNSSQQDAAQAVLQAAVNLGYLAADLQVMESTYQGCGYAVSLPSVCGNGVIEGAEECDGTNLGGATCADVACNLGTVSCTASCTLDFSACSDCAQCNFNGICELGEDCNGCPSDCVSGTAGGACGNGVCEAGDGESCLSCPQDCAGQQGGKPADRFCCGDGSGDNPVACSDSRCTAGGLGCTEVPSTPVAFCCGDLVCAGGETTNNCAVDCGGGCTLGQAGDPCTVDADCCSMSCKGKSCRG